MNQESKEIDVPFMPGVEKRSPTTGVVKGKSNISNFIQECNKMFDEVLFTEMGELHREDHLDYTLYTGNRIMFHY